LGPCLYNIFDSASDLELNPEVLTLTPGTLYMKLGTEVKMEKKGRWRIKREWKAAQAQEGR